jgi:hypothetical protein
VAVLDVSLLSRRVVLCPLLALTTVWACNGKVETSTVDPDARPRAPCTGSGCGRDAGEAPRPPDEDAGTSDPRPCASFDPVSRAVMLDRADFCSREWPGVDCTVTLDGMREGFTCHGASTEGVTQTVGCGILSMSLFSGGKGATYHFDEATGELVGMEYTTDFVAKPCPTNHFGWGHVRGLCSSYVETPCRAVQPPQDAGGRPPPPTPPADAGAVTACSGPGDDAPCRFAEATCWDGTWTVAACAELYDPLCACPGGACACWGQFGTGGQAYPDSPASTCESTEDITTCASASARCWSVHESLADPCSTFAGPVCDCDYRPCRCWADERSRISP